MKFLQWPYCKTRNTINLNMTKRWLRSSLIVRKWLQDYNEFINYFEFKRNIVKFCTDSQNENKKESIVHYRYTLWISLHNNIQELVPVRWLVSTQLHSQTFDISNHQSLQIQIFVHLIVRVSHGYLDQAFL